MEIRYALKKWENKEYIDNKTYKKLHCNDGTLPRAYAFPKIHKTGSQFRIIISYVDNLLYPLTAFLQDLIGQYVLKPQSHIDNSFMLVKRLNGKFLEDEHALISLNVPCSPTEPCSGGIDQQMFGEKMEIHWQKILKKEFITVVQLIRHILFFTSTFTDIRHSHGFSAVSHYGRFSFRIFRK